MIRATGEPARDRGAEMRTVDFVRMEDGTREEYEFLAGIEREYTAGTAGRILELVASLEHSLSGYKVSRLEHCLQTATRAYRDGASEEMVVAALVHDVGDGLAPHSHGAFAASILAPYVSEEVRWVVEHHGLFQGYYYFHHVGGDRSLRERHAGHPHYQACIDFCARWDQCSFDPDYPSMRLELFEPMVARVFAREPFVLER